jgi:hypothetical protein
MSRRAQLVAGLSLIGTIGWLIGAWVMPGQWLSGHVRHEALIGVAVSSLCVLAAAAIARRIQPIGVAMLSTVGISTAGYAVLFFMAAVQAGWTVLFGFAGALALGLSLVAAGSFWALSRIKRSESISQ